MCEGYEGVELPLTSSTVGKYTGSCGFPNTVMYESITGYGFGGRYRLEGTFVQLCWECGLQDIYTLGILPLPSQFEFNIISRSWRENKRRTWWLNFDDTSKFWGEKYIGSSRLNIYRFFFASRLQMTHELNVYKVKACLLRPKCRVSSKYKTQVLFSLDLIYFQFLYVIGSHISLIR